MPNLDPAAPNALAAAVEWVLETLLGTTATAVAVVAVASVGFLLMTGRIGVRRAVQVIVGCFVLFGASTMSAGLMRTVGNESGAPATIASTITPPVYPTSAPKAQVPAVPYDPYAGAALPTR